MSDSPFPNLRLVSPTPSDELEPLEEVVPNRLEQARREARLAGVPEKSRLTYDKHYSEFKRWLTGLGGTIEKISDEDIAAYVNERLKGGTAPTTLWARVSAIKKVHVAGHEMPHLVGTTALLKAKGKAHEKKKAAVFTDAEMKQFLHMSAGDEGYVSNLQMRLSTMLSIHGGLRKSEIFLLKFEDIVVERGRLLIDIPPQEGMKTGRKKFVCESWPSDVALCPVTQYGIYCQEWLKTEKELKGRLFFQVIFDFT